MKYWIMILLVAAPGCAMHSGEATAPAASNEALGLTASTTPNPDAPDELGKLKGLVGVWKCQPRDLQQDGTYQERSPAVWTFFYGLNGYALVDEWRSTRPDGTPVVGINVRHVDPETGKWTARWLVSRKLTWESYSAGFEDGDFVMTGDAVSPSGNPGKSRITFHDIEPDHFSWKLDWSKDAGKTWIENVFLIECERTGS